MATTQTSWLNHVGQWLGTKPRTEFDLANLAERRLATDVVRVMTARGLTAREVYALVIPERTLKHRRSRRERLSQAESDRAIRAARVLARAQEVLGAGDRALGWMREPKRRFGGRTPLEMLGTEAGGRLVEEMLTQIDEGIFA